MNWEKIVSELAGQPWVKQLAGGLGSAVGSIFGEPGGPVENFLHGTWLGHPLHPVLTDIPVGAWTVTQVLDASDVLCGKRQFSSGADAALGLGLLTALGTAASGLADWGRLSGKPKRIGAVHATLNISATVLYAGSLLARRSGARGLGRALSLAGYTLVIAGAYLGGHLVFGELVGVDHTADKPKLKDFKAVMPDVELMEGTLRKVDVEGAEVLLVRRDGQIYAMSDICSHLGCSLAEGHVEGDSVRCDCHGSRFALADGKVLDGPSTYRQPAYRIRVVDGQIQVGGALE